MRIKDGKGKKIELIFLITATTFTVFLLIYLVWLVSHLVEKADTVFSVGGQNAGAVPTFNFEKYDQLFGTTSSSSPPVAPASASSSATTP